MPGIGSNQLDPRVREVFYAAVDRSARVAEFPIGHVLRENSHRRFDSLFLRLGDAEREQFDAAFMAYVEQKFGVAAR